MDLKLIAKKNNWKIKKLDKVTFFQEGPGVRNHQYTKNGVKLLNVANLFEGQLDLSRSDRFISEDEAYGKYRHFLADEGDLIIACSGIQVDYFHKKMGFVKKEHLPLCMNTSTMRFKALDDNILDLNYLAYYLKTDFFKNQIQRLITGSAQLNFGPSHIKKIDILIPSLESQKKIVKVLDKAQGLIDARKEQIRLMDELIQSVFYEMFGDPVTNPKGWEISKLKNHVINIESGWSPKCLNNDASINKWGVLKLSAVTGGQYKEEHNKELPEGILPKLGLEIKDGDLLLTRKNTPELVGDSCFVFRTREKLMMPDIIFRIQTKQTLNRLFLWAVFNTNGLKFRIKSLASGSAKSMSNISKAKLYDLEVVVPSIELQNDFENQVREVVEYKELLLQSLLELETYNKALFRESFESN